MSITCIVPARNEAGHLYEVIHAVNSIETISKIIICEGGSTDGTEIEARKIAENSNGKVHFMSQSGTGKFNAVLEAAAHCDSKFIIIWDADGTVSPSDTNKIISVALETGDAVIGNRLRGKMERGSMQWANYVANWVFGFIWAPFINWKIVDLLCGTKIFPIQVFRNISVSLSTVDPYGDFTLVASSIRCNIKIHSVPVDYSKRKYGKTNIKRWSGGYHLLRTYLRFALRG